ncbi:MAG: EAL domain-containing protein, partial [Deinococcus sp.]|nr:EAL domain-containing protein [Deinococcus sp.]
LALRLAEGLPASQQLLTGYHELARILEELGDAPGALGALRRHHQLETELLEAALYGRTRLLAMQLQLDRLEFQATEQQRRGDQLAAINRTLQATQAELAYRAAHDTLTGLPNRPALDQQLEAICQTSPPQLTAVLFIDLDHFKQINDTLGHPVGDQLLQEVAQRLLRTVQPGDVVARQGGDEFALLLRSVQDIAQAKQTAQRLLEQLSTPVEVGGRPLFISASIGIALFPQHGGDAVTLQKHADLALHEAKQERGRYRIYQPALGAEALEQLTLEQAMHSALQTGGFSLHYQPVVDSCSGCPLMVEALLRWRSPWGEVSPRLFIPIAERSDLILHLGLWVARTALHQLREWRQIWPELKVSVNVSARQLTQPDLPEQFAALLHESGLDPSALVLELTEAAAVDSRRLRAFQELQEAGLSVALDDVGTGYASLAGLAQLPMQMIKIDRSLTAQVASAPQGRSTRPLMNALITFGRESGLHVVAEGVETAEQLEVLRSWGPIQIQGYLESPPLPTADMTEYLQWKAKHCPAQECE